MAGADDDATLSKRERAHLERRDRKRETRMVVDNAGVKRLRRAISEQQARKPEAPAREPAP